MKLGKKYRILSLILAVLIVFGTASISIASAQEDQDQEYDIEIRQQRKTMEVDETSNQDLSSGDTEVLFQVDQINGKSATSTDTLFEVSVNTTRIASGPQILNFTMGLENAKFVINFDLQYRGSISNIKSYGTLYKNEKTENARTFVENLVLAEMEDAGNIHFVQLLIDKEKSYINLILQEFDTKELLQFEIPIDISLFYKIYDSHTNSIKEKELEEKIIDLYSVDNNLIDAKEVSFKIEGTLPSGSTDFPDSTGSSDSVFESQVATISGWKKLLRDLNNNGKVKLSNYAIETNDFKGTNGFNIYSEWGQTPYMVAIYSKQNGSISNEYITQFSLVDVVSQSIPGSSGYWSASLQASFYDGMIVHYNTNSDELTLLYANFGISFDEFTIALNGLTNNAIFYNRYVFCKAEKQPKILKAALAIFAPTINKINTVWDYFQPHETQDNDTVEKYDTSYSNQYIRYGGKVIRGIQAGSGDTRLSGTGHKISIQGGIIYNVDLGTTWMYGYHSKVYANI